MLVDYYLGFDCPILRIDTQSRESILKLKEVFERLADEQNLAIELSSITPLRFTKRVHALTFRNIGAKEPRKSLILTKTVGAGALFEWSKSTEGWQKVIELTDPLIECLMPCHQYFTDPRKDDALLEIAFKEGRPDSDRLT